MNLKSRYISSAFLMLITSVIVKLIGAVYKIPLTAFIGAVGRGYFATAYNLCLPIHAITMGAFPIAISRLVSKYNASSDVKMVRALRFGSSRLMLVVGVIGMSAMLVLAVPYCIYIAHSPKSIYTAFVLAPSIFFSSLAASYRGYYEGFMNMIPTSVSQSIEALSKMIFGLLFSRLSMVYLFDYFSSRGMSDDEVLSLAYPFTSAFAMLGVTLGSFISLLFVWVYYIVNRDRMICVDTDFKHRAFSEILSFSFPIMISCAVQSVFQFLDTATVQYSLGNIDTQILKNVYSSSIDIMNVSDADISTYVYGLLGCALDFKNLVPGVTMSLGICAVPAVSRAVEMNDAIRARGLVSSIYKYTMIISSFGGVAIAVFSKDILMLFYGESSYDIVLGATNLVRAYALSIPIYSLAGTAVFVVQAVGKPEKSITSYIVSGVIRVGLNLYLITQPNLLLNGAVISGAVGYLVLCVWNICVSGMGADIKNVFLKPIFVSFVSYYAIIYITSHIAFSFTILENLLIKLSLFAILYCILCFLCRILNFEQIFCAIKLLKNRQNP